MESAKRIPVLISRKKYPNLKIGSKGNEILVAEQKSRKTHGSIALLQGIIKVEFQKFKRTRGSAAKMVSMVTILNNTGCSIILKDELPSAFASFSLAINKKTVSS